MQASQETAPVTVRPITNESFIGGLEKDGLERLYDSATMNGFWDAMSAHAPDKADMFGRNNSLVAIAEGVVRGERPMTGDIQDARKICEIFFERQGSVNPLRGPQAPDRLFRVAALYLDLCSSGITRVQDSTRGWNSIPQHAATLFKTGKIHDALSEPMTLEQQTRFGDMLLDVSRSYEANETDSDKASRALGNTMLSWAGEVFKHVNPRKLSANTAPVFLARAKREAWAKRYDIAFTQLRRNSPHGLPEGKTPEDVYKRLLMGQLAEAEVMFASSRIPPNRATSGLLYEYFLPASLRFFALQEGQQDDVEVRKATAREDMPLDGITLYENEGKYDKYSFDLMLLYPNHDRRIFLQTKLGRNTDGYDEGVKVFNAHTNVRNIRDYMLNAVRAMQSQLKGNRLTEAETRILAQERLRISSLLPETIE